MTEVESLQATLEGEHAALYVYGVLGAQTSVSTTPAVYAAMTDAYAVHRSRRDQLTRFVLDAGGAPVAAAPTYELPERLGSVARVTRAALEIERACASTYSWLVANTAGPKRAWAVAALTNTAVRELTFRGSPEIFPGAGEYADH